MSVASVMDKSDTLSGVLNTLQNNTFQNGRGCCCCSFLCMNMSYNLFREEDGQWKEEQKLEAHSDWVRDVAWAPSIGLPTSTIASCSQVRLSSVRNMLALTMPPTSRLLCCMKGNQVGEIIQLFHL